MFEKMLVCLDGSELAEQILPYAKEQALFFNSDVVLLHVVHEPFIVTPGVPGAPGYPIQTDGMLAQTKKEISESRDYLNRVAPSFIESGLSVECVVLEGPPGESIVRYANEHGTNLIAIATHGRSGIKRAILGSVADFVLKESGLPVLVIKPQKGEIQQK